MENKCYQLAENVLFQKVDDETVLLEPTTGQYYTLDPVGTFMVEQLIEGHTFGVVLEKVTNTYSVELNEVSADLKELITSMIEQSLIVEVA